MKSKRLFILPAFAMLLGLSACSSGSSDSTSAPSQAATEVATETASDATPPADATTPAAGAGAAPGRPAASPELRDCLKANGLDLPEGGFGGAGATPPSLPEGLDPAVIQKALAACKDKLPAGAGLPGAGAGGPDISAFATCLKDNGVEIPENPKITDIPINDPKFAEASKTCAPLAPGRLGARASAAATDGTSS